MLTDKQVLESFKMQVRDGSSYDDHEDFETHLFHLLEVNKITKEQYETLEHLVLRGYQYNTSNATLSRDRRGELGWEHDVWCPQLKGYRRWFTEYMDLGVRVWYDEKDNISKITTN